ncbi:MAG: hypothetical protein BGO55_24255 [Sphingobacteriales bacterium 50-39]|nr:hypothetical protein [Sphingobacteriales bacterium]OJW58409.1 MAG: hypothetical protein BGO55_24255 [Sphingobacteriales bacterium 50-39]
MRLLFTITFSMIILGATAQTHLFVPSFNVDAVKSKWQLRPFASLTAGYMFFNGGSSMSYMSAPVGLALFRPLSSNWTAYGAATITPTFFNINSLSTLPVGDPNYHGYPFQGGYGMGLTPGIQGGLIYTNDAKTFSISGHVRVERNSYPVYPTERRVH